MTATPPPRAPPTSGRCPSPSARARTPTPSARRGWPPGPPRRSSPTKRRPSTSLVSPSSCALCKPMGMFAPTWRVLPRPAFDVETEAPCGTSVAEAREALAFWRTRLKRLPWYRRAARAEARAMVGRWQRRVVQAELERWRLHALARPLPAAIDWWGPSRRLALHRVAKTVLRASPLARMLAVAAAAVTVAAVAVLALAVVAIAQLL